MKRTNLYGRALGADLYERAPKAVIAAVAVSVLTIGGDHMEDARDLFLREWWALYRAGIVPQRPPFQEPPEETEGSQS